MHKIIVLNLLFILSFEKIFTQFIIELPSIEIIDSKKNQNKKQIDSSKIFTNIGCSIKNIIKEESNIFIKNQNSNISFIRINGASINHTKILWNGIPINSTLNGFFDINILPIRPDANYYLHSCNASNFNNGNFGGTIEIITNNNINYKAVSSIEYETLKNFKVFHSQKFKGKKNNYIFNIFYGEGKNNFKILNKFVLPNFFQTVKEPFNHINIDISFLHKSKNNKLKYDISFGKKNDCFSPLLIANNTNIKELFNSNYLFSALNYSFIFNNNSLKSTFGITYTLNEYTNERFFENKTINKIYSLSYNINYFFSCYYNFIFQSFNLKSGFNFLKNFGKYFQTEYYRFNALESSFNYVFSISRRFNNLEPILDGSLIIFRKKIYLIPSINCFISKNKNSLKISIFRNIRIPTINELYFIPGGNKYLKPESSLGIEVNNIFNLEKLRIESKINHQNIKDWILWMPTYQGYWTASNIRNCHLYNFSLSASLLSEIQKVKIENKISYNFSKIYGFDGEEKIINNPYIPVHSINTNLIFEYRKFFISLESFFYGKRYPYAYNNMFEIKENFIFNLNLKYTIVFSSFNKLNTENVLDIILRINNITNQDYYTTIWRAYPKRYFEFSIKYIIK